MTHILLLTQALAQPCWTYHCSALAQPYTGPCSALLDTDRPLLGPAGRIWSALLEILLLNPTGACSALLVTGPCSALLDTDRPLLGPAGRICWKYYCSTLQVLARSCWSQALAQPCWTQALAGHRPLFSPDGHRPLLDTGPCSALLDTGPCWTQAPAGHRPLLDTGPCSALLDTGPC